MSLSPPKTTIFTYTTLFRSKLYEKDRKIFNKLKKILPKYIYSFPINKNEISNAILANKSNLKRIGKIVHLEIRKKMNIFLRKNKKKKDCNFRYSTLIRKSN